MAYLLRTLILLMIIGIFFTIGTACGFLSLTFNHIQLAIPAFIFLIFVQAFVMFYFIGVARLVDNVHFILKDQTQLDELFEQPPQDLTPYISKVDRFIQACTVCKRQTIPWTMLMLCLGMLAFLLGGAHDTGLVQKEIHVGVVYGFTVSMFIGFFRQWYYLGKSHRLLRELKTLFSIPDGAM